MPKSAALLPEEIFHPQDFDIADEFSSEAGGGREGATSQKRARAAARQSGGGNIVAAVSGGGDSLAMLLLLYAFLQQYGQQRRLIAVTVDHGLRAESADEAAYAAELCRRFGIAHEILYWRGEKPKTGLQAAARMARYALLAEAAEKHKAAILCTAHTLDDQIETYTMRKARLRRETAAADFAVSRAEAEDKGDAFAPVRCRGLAGMARLSLLYGRLRLLRPLLSVRRADLRAFLQSKNIRWIEDSSNANPHYERARVRLNLAAAKDETEAERKEQSDAVIQTEIAAAAQLRQNLSAQAALLGRRLRLHYNEGQFLCDLTPLQQGYVQTAPAARESGGSPQQAKNKNTEPNKAVMPLQDYAALYVLLAYAAAILGNKTFADGNNERLKRFIPILFHSRKGEPPRRISIAGAVAEKRQNRLILRREERAEAKTERQNVRAKPQLRRGENAELHDTQEKPQTLSALSAAPFRFLVSGHDMPLFSLFSDIFAAHEKKTGK